MADSISKVIAAGAKVPATQVALLDELAGLIDGLQTKTDALIKASEAHAEGDTLHHAQYFHATIVPAMLEVRTIADKLEGIVAADLWPLPTYQEMLFIK